MELQKFKDILEKYYEGLSSLNEEKELKLFLKHYNGDDADLNEAKVFFGLLDDSVYETVDIDFKDITNSKPKSNTKRIYLVLSSVAASLIIGISLTFLLNTNNSPIVYAYVDGQPITNKQEAIKYSQQALLSLQSNLNKGTNKLDYVNKINKPVELLTVKN